MNLLKAQIEAATVAQIVETFKGEEDETIRALIADATCFEEMLQIALNELCDTQSIIEAISIRQKALQERKSRIQAREDRMREFIAELLNRANVRKVELGEATLSLGNAPQSVRITDEAALAPQFIRTKTEPDRTAIKDALKRGEAVAGAELSNGGEILTIRRK